MGRLFVKKPPYKIDFSQKKLEKISIRPKQPKMISHLYRNFLVANVVYLPVGTSQRRQAFEALKTPTMPVIGDTYPFNSQRYAHVTKKAKELAKNMASITAKTRFCSRGGKCDTTICQFAHSIEEWNPPFCLQQEFCLVPDCDKNHGLTKEEFVELKNIKVPTQKKTSLECTQFCRNMKGEMPCGHKGCTFAHSLWEYKAIPCHRDAECVDVGCVKKHTTDSIFYYMERQGVPFKLWMLRAPTYNNSEQSKRLIDQSDADYAKWITEWSDDFRRYDGEQDLVNQFKALVVDVASVNVDDDEDVAVTFRIGTTNTMGLLDAIASQRFEKFEQFEQDVIDEVDIDVEEVANEPEDEDDHQLSEEDMVANVMLDQLSEEDMANVMLAAADLDLDFETVNELIENGKSGVIFEWHKRRFEHEYVNGTEKSEK